MVFSARASLLELSDEDVPILVSEVSVAGVVFTVLRAGGLSALSVVNWLFFFGAVVGDFTVLVSTIFEERLCLGVLSVVTTEHLITAILEEGLGAGELLVALRCVSTLSVLSGEGLAVCSVELEKPNKINMW